MCNKPKVWLLKNFLIFFSSSGQVIPPIDYNGFKATVEFISRTKGRLSSSGNDDGDEDDDGGQSNSKKQNKGRKNRGRKGGGECTLVLLLPICRLRAFII